VGSRLHGLADENSDIDLASVVATPLRDVISPFHADRVKQPNDESDHVRYELRDFCKLATKGNPTILEVLWSNREIEKSVFGEFLRANRHRLLSGTKIYYAHRGYAKSQWDRMETSSSDHRRVGKAAVAYIRVLSQGVQLLRKGDFSPQVLFARDLMLDLKRGADLERVNRVALPVFNQLEDMLRVSYESTKLPEEPDIDWIESFLYDAYTGAH
jgi:predicted nucleotidyltransferase